MSLLKGDFASRFYVWRNGNQGPYAPAALPIIEFNTEVFDGLNEMDIVATWRFTPRRAGHYLLIASSKWNLANGEGSGTGIFINGVLRARSEVSAGPVNATQTTCSCVAYLTPNDFADVRAYWDLVGIPINRSIFGVQSITYFMGHRLS